MVPFPPYQAKGGCMDFRETYFEIWETAWNFHEQFAGMGGTDQEWERVVDAAGEIVENYKGTLQYEFVKSLIMAIIAELERVDKRRRSEDMENEKKI